MAEILPPDAPLPLFEGYTLDRSRGAIVRGGERVPLRPQSFDVLRYLAEHRGRLVSKSELIEEVWRGRAVTDDSLVQCLRDVRRALGPGTERFLRNVRGRGYILEHAAHDGSEFTQDHVEIVRVVVEETEEASPRVGEATRIPRRLAAAALVLIASAAIGVTIAFRSPGVPALDRIETLAILPFVNESGDSEAEYLSNGIAESLITSLSRLPGLTVKARSSVFRYKGQEVEAREVARDLSVQAVLSGRAVRVGDNLTLYLSLTDGGSGNQLWGEQYHHTLTDLVALEQDIVRDVSAELRSRLAAWNRPASAAAAPPKGAAYQLFLKGRYLARFRHTKAEVQSGIALLEEAVAIDPGFANAYVALADAHRRLPIAYNTAPLDAFPTAKAYASKALQLDASLVDAYVVLGWISFWFDWNWDEADRLLQRALALDPSNPEAYRASAHRLSNLGRHERAFAEVRRAVDLDPFDPMLKVLEGQFLFYGGRLDDAVERFEQALVIEPRFWIAVNGLGRVDILRGRFDEAIATLERAAALSSGSAEPLTQLGYAYARAGREKEARSVMARLAALEGHVPAYNFAMIYNGLADRDRALDYLERSVRAREVQATFMGIDTRWGWLRADPRFAAQAQVVGLAR